MLTWNGSHVILFSGKEMAQRLCGVRTSRGQPVSLDPAFMPSVSPALSVSDLFLTNKVGQI